MVLYRVKVEIKGKENIPKKTFIAFGNHKSMMDVPITYYAYKSTMSAVSKKQLEKVIFLKTLIDSFKVITIDRDNDREALKSIISGIKDVEKGLSMMVFPEGGIKSRETELMVDAKPGAYKLATKPQVLVSPFSIIGTSKFKTKKRWKKITIKFIIHKPIYPEEYNNYSPQELADKVFAIVNEGVINATK
ncbi:MAG: lysophospholipid acyltransferase family protein [Anaeroplasmataceae bacterium]